MAVGNNTSTSATYIYPSNKHKREPPPERIPFSALDDVQGPCQAVHYWHFLKVPIPINAVVEKLKDSLAEALELYIPLTGTLYRDDTCSSWYIAMDSKNRQGTPFIVETRDEPYSKEDDMENLEPRGTAPLPPGSSIFAVKVTQFSCGSLVICGSMDHQVVDLHGYNDFMKVWARLTEGEPVDLNNIPDDWSRTPCRFFPSHQGEPVFPFDSNATTKQTSVPPPQQQVETVIWKTAKDSIHRLKMDLSATVSSKDQWISSGDALSALVFGALTRAREKANVLRTAGLRSSVESQTESLYTVCDCRSRALPEGKGFRYFGNTSMLCKATVPRDKLLSPTIEDMSHTALLIRNEIRAQLSPHAIANYIAFYEDLKAQKRSQFEVFPVMDAFCTNCLKFDVHMDFGWGKSYKAIIITEDFFKGRPSGIFCMLPGKELGDVEMRLRIEADAVKYLDSDPLLRKYMTKKIYRSHL